MKKIFIFTALILLSGLSFSATDKFIEDLHKRLGYDIIGKRLDGTLKMTRLIVETAESFDIPDDEIKRILLHFHGYWENYKDNKTPTNAEHRLRTSWRWEEGLTPLEWFTIFSYHMYRLRFPDEEIGSQSRSSMQARGDVLKSFMPVTLYFTNWLDFFSSGWQRPWINDNP